MPERLSRRRFLRHAAGVTCAAMAGLGARAGAEAGRRPNIVFIYTDDQAAWALHASGNADVHTPNLDRLFSEGVTLSNCFVTTPVCSPSRVGLLTSRYGSEVGIPDWISPQAPKNGEADERELGLDPSLPTWVRDLRDAGYATGLVGKWHLGVPDRFHPSHFGYAHFTGFREGGAKVIDPDLEKEGVVQSFQGLTVDILTDHAIEFVKDHAEKLPFLLSLHYRSPHAPWSPVAPEDSAPYDGKKLEAPNLDFPDLDVERVEKLMAEYLASVSGVDRNVGRVLAEIEGLGIAENTIVVFTSDHGYNVGHHGLLHKGNARWITHANATVARPNMFDTSLRTPACVRWPGKLEAGARIGSAVTNLDWFPTLLALAGVSMPADRTIHGRDFSPLLLGEEVAWDEAFYGEYSIRHYTSADLRMYRSTEWKLIRDFMNEGKDELYHLAEDPGETVNLIDDEGAKAVRDQLHERLLAKMRSIKDPVLEPIPAMPNV